MNRIRKTLLGFAVLAIVASCSFAQQAASGSGRYDAEIQQKATKLLQSKDKWKGITAAADDGIVTLQGSTKIYIDKIDAAKKVDKIEHVDGIRNHVQVESSASDSELMQKLADKLAYDRIGFGITFNALTLKVENGVATVGGDVRDYASRDSALAIVENTVGVKDVVDNINVLPTSPFDDDLRVRVARAVYGAPALSRYAMDPQKPIRIIVDNGNVTLLGVVATEFDKQIAETQARGVPNVFSVKNQLVVAGPSKK
jgi:hyperosmotically inducible periplasmic protein